MPKTGPVVSERSLRVEISSMTTSLPSLRRLRRTVRRATGTRRRHEDRGASAVEFALVSPLLFTLLFATIDYGLYFADVLTVQQRTTDAARDATLSVGSVAANWPGAGNCGAQVIPLGSATDDLAKVVCDLSASVQPLGGGVLSVKAEVVDAAGAPVAQWLPGNRLRVCSVTEHPAVLPFVPLPAGGVVRSHVDMPIQPGQASLLLAPVAQPAPADSDWSWC